MCKVCFADVVSENVLQLVEKESHDFLVFSVYYHRFLTKTRRPDMKKIKQKGERSKAEVERLHLVQGVASEVSLASGRLELIQQLIPLAAR